MSSIILKVELYVTNRKHVDILILVLLFSHSKSAKMQIYKDPSQNNPTYYNSDLDGCLIRACF